MPHGREYNSILHTLPSNFSRVYWDVSCSMGRSWGTIGARFVLLFVCVCMTLLVTFPWCPGIMRYILIHTALPCFDNNFPSVSVGKLVSISDFISQTISSVENLLCKNVLTVCIWEVLVEVFCQASMCGSGLCPSSRSENLWDCEPNQSPSNS